MSLGISGAVWGGIIAAGGAIASSKMSSDAQKKQAQIQANAIQSGGAIDSAARNKAISQVLEIFGPSLVDFNESMQGSIDLLEQGRISTGDLLTQSANNVSRITQQGGQSALNAMLGLPSPETVSTAQQPQTQAQAPQGQVTQQQAQDALPSSIINDDAFVRGAPKIEQQPIRGGIKPTSAPQGGIGSSLNVQPDGTVRPGGGINQIRALATDNAFQQGAPTDFDPNSAFTGIGPNPVNPDSIYQSTAPLEGELLPRDYDFNQQGVTMPQGTNTGFLGAVDAVQAGADLGRQDLARGAAGSLESLGTQFGIARDDIGEGRDFALNQIQQAIQAGRSGINQGVGSIQQGTQQGVNAINTGVDQAVGFLNPYMSAGKEALNPLLALSGVRGQEAFDAALINDPAYNLALQESERALGRSAAITGGIGSGNVKGRFQLNAQQQAAADIDRQLGRFRSITDAGQRAAGTAGGFATQGGIAAGGLESRGGIASGQMQARGGELEADQLNQMASVGIRSSEQLSQIAQALGINESQVLQSLGGNLANIDVSTGQQIGGMREQAGINAANIIQGTSNQQAGIDAGLAQQLAGLDQDTLNNIINSIQSGAGTNLSSQQQLATILANMGVNAGTSGQQTAINLGQAEAAGVTNPIGNAINTGIGLYASGAFNQGVTNPYQPIRGNTTADYTGADYQNWVGSQ
jgi:hypothetical protein